MEPLRVSCSSSASSSTSYCYVDDGGTYPIDVLEAGVYVFSGNSKFTHTNGLSMRNNSNIIHTIASSDDISKTLIEVTGSVFVAGSYSLILNYGAVTTNKFTLTLVTAGNDDLEGQAGPLTPRRICWRRG